MKKLVTFIMLGSLLFVLLASIFELPPMGDQENPSYNEIATYYIEESTNDTGSINLITAIITDYRAFDTLGEATVLFAGIIAVTTTVGVTHHKQKRKKEGGSSHG